MLDFNHDNYVEFSLGFENGSQPQEISYTYVLRGFWLVGQSPNSFKQVIISSASSEWSWIEVDYRLQIENDVSKRIHPQVLSHEDG